MKQKAVQKFTSEYLEQCKSMSSDEILEFLDNYRQLVTTPQEKCVGISLKVEPSLLAAFKTKARLSDTPYQTQIKRLMKKWLLSSKEREIGDE